MEEKIVPLISTVYESQDWKELEQKENEIGPEKLLDEIINKKVWTNSEILWIIRRMIFYYGKKDEILKNAPVDRIFTNMVDVLRAFYILLDRLDPEVDDNLRSYVCAKLSDATWGINDNTRSYLYKMKK
ncbi:hypothetical protein SYNTR_1039 [Candidatus Syntrophocurvum alkaliphilum]|uniref:Uncharacterized protein n=1 Tax=Candidatus Syntrophocurvum alkaliphilum TaxID=2293317 RepID=A0A6I6DF72_9FIRM|nr:hypothetical protein [Candidatus Syntrophocurvum alkaliphilum]QGT99632.1 hypothetical protein SYNTR_1039 [Candidatus Syntrophocurvum alkaliphilum]